MNQVHKGFTLIELVVVIVILGILAATALPKFVDLGKDARIAKVNAMAGALKSAATQGRSICAIVGGTLCPTNTAVVFNYQGKSYNFVMGYPEAGNYLNGGQIDSFVDTTGFTLSLSASTDATRFSVTDAPDPANCWANYEQAWDVNTGPKITTETKGCGNS